MRAVASVYGPLSLAVVLVSFGSILVRKAHAPALAVAFYRVGLAAAALMPVAAAPAIRAWPRLTVRQRLALVGAGTALAVHFASWIASLEHTSVAASVVLVNTAPLVTVALSRVFLGERSPRAVLVAVALAVPGVGLIAAGDWARGEQPLTGAILALCGAVAFAVYQVAGRGLRDALPLGAYVLAVWTIAAVGLAAAALVAGVPLTGYSGRTLVVFAALALVPTLGGHGLVNRSLRVLPAPTVGVFLLGEPVGAAVLAYSLLGEVPGDLTLAGGAVVLAALVLVVLAERR